jgi:hypothetical protein
MPRKGEKSYKEEDVLEAVRLVKEGMSVRNATAACNVPKSTIDDRVSGKHGGLQGRPPVLTKEEEGLIIEMVDMMCDWGFPFTKTDLCYFVQSYLNKRGGSTRFKDNLPSRRFVDSFLGRHPEFTMRRTNPIKCSRASLSREEVAKFFKNYVKSVQDVPPENIYNYDKSPLRDDPGSSSCIYRKGTKYPEKVQNSSKQCISVMFCGNVAGEMVPPMVVYKAKNLYSSWKGEDGRGIKGAHYSTSLSGWFDMFPFEEWFAKVLLPILKKKQGKKLIMGDNLASHISPRVIELCKQHNIQFVCLPPHSTDKMQPLDVWVFSSMKSG